MAIDLIVDEGQGRKIGSLTTQMTSKKGASEDHSDPNGPESIP